MSNENNVEFLYIGTISYKVYAKGMGGGGVEGVGLQYLNCSLQPKECVLV